MKAFPSKFNHAEDSIGLSFIKVYNTWHHKIKTALTPLEITHPQFTVMASIAYLLTKESEVKQIDISLQADIDVMTVSQIILNLEKKALLMRQPSHRDARAKVVTLTEQGQEVLVKALHLVEKIDQQFFSHLNEEKGSFNQCLHLLNKANQ